ncbi:MAG: dephospho-CoA kinase [Nitrospirae bacterium]|nr:dephospho-CoA kinase [Nitrospirota bacterium]
MLIVGLTGNYGMGKSAVLSMFRELGAFTVDADKIVRGLLRENKVISEIKSLFGSSVFDETGRLDKEKVAEKIFKNKLLRLKLEDVIHPRVFKKISELSEKAKNKNKVFIVEAPLIFERKYEDRFEWIITVFSDEKTAIKRLAMHGITSDVAGQRLRCQLSIIEKIKKADYSIDNSRTPDKTKKQVQAVYKELLKETKAKKLILEGKVDKAAKILEKPFSIEGKVIKGAGRGEKILHTPTANISFKGYCPKEGVYAVKVSVAKGKGPRVNGVANIGKNPTFGASELSFEVHILNFTENLLGKTLKVFFLKRIRDEKKFSSAKALEMQIKKDIKKAKEILSK